MKKIKIISLIFIILSLHACQESGLAGEIIRLKKQAENAIEEIDDFKAIDFSKEQEESHHLVKQLSPYFAQLKGASLQVLVLLANTEKAHKKWEFNFDQTEQDLKYSIKQLSSLHDNLKSGKLSPKEVQKYVSDETIALNELLNKVAIYKTQISYLESHYSDYIPQAEQLVDSLKNSSL